MKKNQIVKGIIFCFIFLFLLISVSYIVRTNGEVKERFAGFYAQKKNSIDVLLMGASPVGTSFAPGYMWEQYGFTSYPLSTNTQRPKAIKYLLQEGYRYQKPEVVVIELRMFAYPDKNLANDTAHIREVTDNMKYSFQRIKTINAIATDVDEPLYTFYFDIFKFHSNWRMLLLPDEVLKFRYVKEDINKGFENPITVMKHETPENVIMSEMIPIPEEQEKILKDLMYFLKENNQKALFVVTPKVNSKDYQGKMNYIKKLVEEQGFSYLNFNELYEDINFDFTTDLLDGAHTNILGAKKCSNYLGQYLTAQYQLEDKRSKKQYADWFDSAAAFHDAYETAEQNVEKEKQ